MRVAATSLNVMTLLSSLSESMCNSAVSPYTLAVGVLIDRRVMEDCVSCLWPVEGLLWQHIGHAGCVMKVRISLKNTQKTSIRPPASWPLVATQAAARPMLGFFLAWAVCLVHSCAICSSLALPFQHCLRLAQRRLPKILLILIF